MDIHKKGIFFPDHLIERVINRYITRTQTNHYSQGSLPIASLTPYLTPPYIGHFSVNPKKKIGRFIKRYCNDLDITLVLFSFKIGNMFRCERPYPSRAPFTYGLQSCMCGLQCLLRRQNGPAFFH